VKHNPEASSPATELLSTIFNEYESIRIPRTAELVRTARKQGEIRVVDGIDACLKRNEIIRKNFGDDEKVLDASEYLLSGPYKGKSEI